MTVRQAKTQISLGICPVWSESSLCAQWVAKDPSFMRTPKTLIRLGGCPGWSASSLGAQSFCWFCHEAAQMIIITCISSKLSLSTTQPTKWIVHPAKTQILGIRISLGCALYGLLRTQSFSMQIAKTLVRLCKCPGWSEFPERLFHFSSPELKADKVSLQYTNGPSSVSLSVHFKLEYLWSQLANLDQILWVGERLHKVLGQIGSKLWFPWQQKAPIDL